MEIDVDNWIKITLYGDSSPKKICFEIMIDDEWTFNQILKKMAGYDGAFDETRPRLSVYAVGATTKRGEKEGEKDGL